MGLVFFEEANLDWSEERIYYVRGGKRVFRVIIVNLGVLGVRFVYRKAGGWSLVDKGM